MVTELTAEQLKQRLIYYPEQGHFFWFEYRSGRCRRGAPAGHIATDSGYRFIRVDGTLYRAHRLAWLYVHGCWPEDHVDHINGDRADNRLKNLRVTGQSGNIANSRLSRSNTSGFKGVTKHGKRWLAQIKKNYQRFHLGVFDTPEEAHAAYCAAAERLHGEFARTA